MDGDAEQHWDADWDVDCGRGIIGRDVSVHEASDLVELRGYVGMTGDLHIEVEGVEALGGLECLREVGGHLGVYSSGSLTALDGLDSLRAVGGGLVLQDNQSLLSISALRYVSSFGDAVEIRSNPSLTDLEGLRSVVTINGYLMVEDNASLLSVNGLDALTSLDVLAITRNPQLPQCAAEALVDRLRSHGWTGDATVALNDESTSCD